MLWVGRRPEVMQLYGTPVWPSVSLLTQVTPCSGLSMIILVLWGLNMSCKGDWKPGNHGPLPLTCPQSLFEFPGRQGLRCRQEVY